MSVEPYKTKHGMRYLIRGRDYFKRGFSTRQEAIIFEAQHYRIVKLSILQEMKCEDFFRSFNEFLEERYRMNTVTDSLNKYREFIHPFFGKMKLREISNISFRNYNDWVNSLPIKNKGHVFSYTRVFFRFLEEFGLKGLNYNLFFVKKANEEFDSPRFDYYSIEEFNRFLRGASDDFDVLFFSLLFFLGLRLEEARGIKWKDLEHESGRLFIRRSVTNRNKGNRQHVQPCKSISSVRDYKLPNFFFELFDKYKKTKSWKIKEEDFVFANEDGRVITENPIRCRQAMMEKRSGMRHIKIHAFRHSCATLLFNDSFEIEQVAAWLGHDSPATTMKYYAHLLPKRKDVIADYFEKLQKLKK